MHILKVLMTLFCCDHNNRFEPFRKHYYINKQDNVNCHWITVAVGYIKSLFLLLVSSFCNCTTATRTTDTSWVMMLQHVSFRLFLSAEDVPETDDHRQQRRRNFLPWHFLSIMPRIYQIHQSAYFKVLSHKFRFLDAARVLSGTNGLQLLEETSFDWMFFFLPMETWSRTLRATRERSDI